MGATVQLPAEDRHGNARPAASASRTATKTSGASMASTAFPIGGDWVGSVGGFWRTSDGVRDPQFTADEGGQLTATLKRESDARQISRSTRAISTTRTSSSRPIPVIQRGTRQLQRIPGLRSADIDLLQRCDPARAARRLSGRRHARRISPTAAARRWCSSARHYDHELRQRLVDQQPNCSTTRATSTPTRCSPAAIPRRSTTSCTLIPTNLGGFALPAGIGHRDLRRRRRGSGRPERHPPGLVVHPQGTARTSTTTSGSARSSSTATR